MRRGSEVFRAEMEAFISLKAAGEAYLNGLEAKGRDLEKKASATLAEDFYDLAEKETLLLPRNEGQRIDYHISRVLCEGRAILANGAFYFVPRQYIGFITSLPPGAILGFVRNRGRTLCVLLGRD